MASKLGLSLKDARWWERERRVCHVAKVEFPNRQRVLVANLHATSLRSDRRLAEAELARAVKFIDRQAETEETVIVAGDFNIELAVSPILQDLTSRADERYSPAGPGVNHILVRGRLVRRTLPTPLLVRRRALLDGKLLSDNAPGRAGRARPAPAAAAAAAPAEAAPALPSLAEAQRAAPLPPPAGRTGARRARAAAPAAPPAPGEPATPVEPPRRRSSRRRHRSSRSATPAEPQPTPVEPETQPSRQAYAASAVRSPSSAAIGWSAATTFAMCSSSSSPSSSAPA